MGSRENNSDRIQKKLAVASKTTPTTDKADSQGRINKVAISKRNTKPAMQRGTDSPRQLISSVNRNTLSYTRDTRDKSTATPSSNHQCNMYPSRQETSRKEYEENKIQNTNNKQKAHKRGPRKSKRQKPAAAIKLGYINANGLRAAPKWQEAEELVNNSNLSIALFTETHFRDAEEPIMNMKGFTWIGNNRQEGDKKGGGVGMLIKEDIKLIEAKTCSEHLWLVIKPEQLDHPLAIGLVYMATNDTSHSNDKIRQCLERDIQHWSEKGTNRIVIAGDFNAHINELSTREDTEGTKLKEFTHRANLTIMNTQDICEGSITWQRGQHKTSIDYILSSQDALPDIKKMIIDEENQCGLDSDHNLITICYSPNKVVQSKRKNCPSQQSNIQPRWKLHNEDNMKAFAAAIEQALDSNPDINCDTFIELMKKTGLEKCGKTTKNSQAKHKKPKWLTNEVLSAIRNRQAASRKHRQALKRGSALEVKENWTSYKNKKNETQKLIAQEIRKIDKHLTDELQKNDKQAIKKFWRYLKRSNQKEEKAKGLRTSAGNIVSDSKEIKHLIENHFETQANPTAASEAPSNCEQTSAPFSLAELRALLTTLPNGKASGPDDIPYEFLKCLESKGQQKLLDIYNNILRGEPIPEPWTTARVKLIFKGKNKDPADIRAYRPISLLSNLYKCFATLLKTRMYEELEKSESLGDMQFGFRKNRSTNDGLFLFSQSIESAINQNKPLYAALLDIQTAYDSVDRPRLWAKLDSMGVPKDLAQAIQRIYKKTENFYDWEGIHTSKVSFNVGLRQECPLSALLFIIYLKELEEKLSEGRHGYYLTENLRINAIFYADDIILFAENPIELQSQLDIASNYADNNRLKFSAQKSEIIIFNDKRTPQQKFTLQEEEVSTKEEVTYLGTRFCSNSKHYLDKEVQHRLSKARRMKHLVLANSRQTFNRFSVARTLWKQVATPALTYAFDALPLPPELWKECNKHQLQVGKYAVGANHIAPNISIEGELGWSPFEIREARARNIYAGHILRQKKNTILRQVHDATMGIALNTSWHRKLYTARRKFNIGTNIKTHPEKSPWNKATTETVNKINEERWKKEVQAKPSLHTYQLKKTIAAESFYDNSLGSDLLFQARTGCLPTALRHHEIFGDNPLCKLCKSAPENVEHILLQCRELKQARENLFPNTHSTIGIQEMLGLSTPQKPEYIEQTKRLLEIWWSTSGKEYPYWRKRY